MLGKARVCKLEYPVLNGKVNKLERWFKRGRVVVYFGKVPPSRDAYSWIELQEVPVTESDWEARKATPSTPNNRESGQTTLAETRLQTPQIPLTAGKLAAKARSDDVAAFLKKYESLRRRSC